MAAISSTAAVAPYVAGSSGPTPNSNEAIRRDKPAAAARPNAIPTPASNSPRRRNIRLTAPTGAPAQTEPTFGAAVVDLCHVLLNVNEFAYVD